MDTAANPAGATEMTALRPLAEACAAYAIFCSDARVKGADLSDWTDDDSRAALVPAFD